MVKTKLSEFPLIYTFDNFFSKEECEHICDVAKPFFQRATVSYTTGGGISKGRTGKNCWLRHDHDQIVNSVCNRISDLVQIPLVNCESMQVIHYDRDQEYRSHYDSWTKDGNPKNVRCLEKGGNRIVTCLGYLNEVEEGGETEFTNLKIKVSPKIGKLLVFYNCNVDNNSPHINSLHSGCSVLKGEKYAFNLWFREFDTRIPYTYSHDLSSPDLSLTDTPRSSSSSSFITDNQNILEVGDILPYITIKNNSNQEKSNCCENRCQPEDTWKAPFSIKIINDFLDEKYYAFFYDIIKNRKFNEAKQGVGKNQKVDEKHKIRMDYTLNSQECSVIDKPLIHKANCSCNLRERWRLLYYDGDNDKKAFRDAHTDWTVHSCHRRMSIIIGLSEPHEYDGGELVFPNDNLKYKIGKGSAIIFDGRLLHEVLPVTKGKRYVIQAFLFDDSGWNLKKEKNGYNNFVLLDNVNNDETKKDERNDNKWDIYEDINAVHSKIDSYESDYLGTFNYMKDVYESLERVDKVCFTWHKPSIPNKKWRGRLYAWDLNKLKLKNRTNIKTWPVEKNTVSGVLKVYNTTHKKHSCDEKKLALISTDGGPGNQIVGIKESIIIAETLNRQFIFPPIVQHYVLNHKYRGSNKKIKYWKFSEIFEYKSDEPICELDDNNLEFVEKHTKTVQCIRKQDVDNPLKMETLFKSSLPKQKLSKSRFACPNDIKQLDIDEDESVVTISHVYNSLKISNCFWNGCDICDVNPEFIESYKSICSKFDYSDKIKTIGDQFIKDNLGDNFISIHLRYHDIYNQNIKEINNLYDEADIYLLLNKLMENGNVPVFIATNKQNQIMSSDLKHCKMLPVNSSNDELESFIEQYICCKSTTFLYSGGGHAKPVDKHIRSTWSSFVLDYRYCMLNKKCTDNIYLPNYFENNGKQYGYEI